MTFKEIKATDQKFLRVFGKLLNYSFGRIFSKGFLNELTEFVGVGDHVPWHSYYTDPFSAQVGILSIFSESWKDRTNLESMKSALVDLYESLEKGATSEKKEVLVNSLKTKDGSRFLFSIYAGAINTLCFLEYRTDINTLIAKAKKGRTGALLKLIKLDKTFVTMIWVRKIIIKNQLKNNKRFFKGLAKAINVNLFSKRKREVIKWYVIQLMWITAAPNYNFDQFYTFLAKNTKAKLPARKTLEQRLRRCGLTRRAIKSSFAAPEL